MKKVRTWKKITLALGFVAAALMLSLSAHAASHGKVIVFHAGSLTVPFAKMEKIFGRFQDLGVRYVGPCHCTGETQIKAFQKAYGDHFVKMGVGKIIPIKDLK